MVNIGKKWQDRFVACRNTGKSVFSYAELSEMFQIALANISQKLSEIMEQDPEAITDASSPEVRYKLFKFNYDILLAGIGTCDYSGIAFNVDWMTKQTWDTIMERLDLPNNYRVEFSYTEWNQQYQRGRVVCSIYEGVQRYMEYQVVFLIDNCIIVN